MSMKYLTVFLNDSLSWDTHINTLVSKFNRAIDLLAKILKKNHVYLLFHWFIGENCIIFTYSLHKEQQTSTN